MKTLRWECLCVIMEMIGCDGMTTKFGAFPSATCKIMFPGMGTAFLSF